eukprot:gene4476-8911_t
MSIKVYIHYEADGAPEKTSKLTVPKKWVEERNVVEVIGLFTDAYNAKYPEHSLDKELVHLTTSNDNGALPVFSNDKIGAALSDRTDYFIKKGIHMRQDIPSRPSASNLLETSQLRCKNYGCNMFFTEETNHDTSCRHHIAPPIFHDRVKGWSCCKEKKAYDWDEFKAIEGCTLGKHSTIEKKLLFTESPTVAAANSAEAKEAAAPLKSISDFNTQNPLAATAASSAVKTTTARKSTRKPDGTAKCQNKGCQLLFRIEENNVDACCYHAGQPVFHDAVKFWSCCADKKCYDFDEFMKVPGCKRGWHDDGEIDLTQSSTSL